jgi:hypothetical protein
MRTAKLMVHADLIAEGQDLQDAQNAALTF